MAMPESGAGRSSIPSFLRGRKSGSGDGGDHVATVPSAHQPPPWLGWLLLISLLVMLNTHLFITLAAGIDQYSLYAADSPVPQPYPPALAQQPYPVLLTFLFNVLLAFLAYGIYRLIWRYFAAPRATASGGSERNPFKQNAIALAIPVCIAMAPSILLSYTLLKPYFVIVGALIAIVLCIVGSLRDPDVNLDSSTRGSWFQVAAIATFVMMTLAVIVTFYFQFIPAEPPDSNILWQLEWDLYPLDDFQPRIRGGMLLFGLVSIVYMVAVLGGVMLATLHPPRIGQRSPAPGPGPLNGASVTIFQISTNNPEEWAREILRRLSDEVLGREQDPSYLAVLAGLERQISAGEYARLVDEKRGLLSEVDVMVDKTTGTVKSRTKSGLRRLRVKANPGNATYLALCLYSRRPAHRFTTREMEDYLEDAVGQPIQNVSDIVYRLKNSGVPLVSNETDRVTYIRDGARACFIDRLPPDC